MTIILYNDYIKNNVQDKWLINLDIQIGSKTIETSQGSSFDSTLNLGIIRHWKCPTFVSWITDKIKANKDGEQLLHHNKQ